MAAGSEMSVCLLDDARAELGEGPVWVDEESAVYWVDIKGHRLNRYGLKDGMAKRWTLHDNLAWVLPRRSGGLVAGMRHEIGELVLEPDLQFVPRVSVELDKPGNRLNDAKADPDGGIMFGTMDDGETTPSGAFYRLLSDFSVQCIDTGYVIANGPAVAPDGSFVYHTDSAARTVYRYARHTDGTLGSRQSFIRFAEEDGYPDGMTVDAEGGLWVAHWGGARVSRFLADGSFERALPLPVSQVTSCCFGGKNLDRLFVTTAAIGLSVEMRTREPEAGGLFELDPGISGLPASCFAG